MKQLELSLVLPSYLEGDNLRVLIPRIIHALKDILKLKQTDYEIIVVDTKEPMDFTPELCEELHIRYVNREGENYYGDAIRSAIKEVKGKYTLFMDADGSHSPEFISKLFTSREEKSIIIASRYIKGGYTDNKKVLIWMSKILNKMYGIFLRLKIKDISNSFKLYDTSLLKSLRLTCNNFDIIEEIIYKIAHNNKELTIKEIPYSFKKRMFGETKRNLFLFMFTFFITMIRLIISDLRIDLMLKYLIAAISGLIIDFGIYIFLLKYIQISYMFAGFYGFCSGFLINYSIGRLFVFTSGSRFSYKKEILFVFIISAVGLGIHQVSLYTSVEYLGINKITSKLIAVSVNFLWNYSGRRFFIYQVEAK